MASWLDGASSVKLSSLALNTAVVGEPVEVLVSVSNPLGLELSISRMKLSFEAEPASQSDADEAPDASAAPGEAPGPASEDAPESIATASTLPAFSDSLVPQRLQRHPESSPSMMVSAILMHTLHDIYQEALCLLQDLPNIYQFMMPDQNICVPIT